MCAALMRKLPPVPSNGPSYVVKDYSVQLEPETCYICPATQALNAMVGGLLRQATPEEDFGQSLDPGMSLRATLRDLSSLDSATLRGSNLDAYSTSAFRAELREVEKLFECLRDARDVGRDSGHDPANATPATLRQPPREPRPAAATQRAEDPADPWGPPSPAQPPHPQRPPKKSALATTLGAARERRPGSAVSKGTLRPSSAAPTLERLTRFAAPWRSPQQFQERRALQEERALKAQERRLQLEQDFVTRALEEAQATDEQAEKAAQGKKSREKAEVVRLSKLRRLWLCAVTSAMIAMKFNQARQHWKDLQYAALAEAVAVA